ncbi:MAG: DUF5050 domain-containing protein [Ruminococcaceae bacterium]|nr:DUF5050 domain-containing protein [Oscillospiraceae bacterium]
MKYIKFSLFAVINLILLCSAAFAGNIINEGLFLSHDGVLYYSEQDDGGKLYAQKDGYNVKISDLNAKYINVHQNEIYFCSTDDTGEYAAISKYNIDTGKVVTIHAVEMVKGIKNLYIQDGTAYFQSEGKIFTFSIEQRKIEPALEDGEIVNFIPLPNGFIYTKISDKKTPLYYNNGKKSLRIAPDVSSFDYNDGTVYYTDDSDGALISYTLSSKNEKLLADNAKLSNLIFHNGTIYGKGDDDYTIYSYNIKKKAFDSQNHGIFSFFNIVDGEIKSVYYSGALLSQTLIEGYSPVSLTSYLPDTGTYKSWKQYDSRWANIKFPNGETVKGVGCLVTSIAILIVGSGIRDEAHFNPGTFVESLKNNNGFSGASLYWSAVERVVPEFKVYSSWTSLYGTKKEKADAIASHLNAGRKVVIRAVSNQHWVAADKVENGKVYICDPGRNVTDLFSYYDAEDVTRIAVFHPISSEAVKYESGVYSITSDDGLRLRSGPGLNYDRLDLIPFETVVKIKDVGDGWGYTTYKGTEGWVFMEYTKYISPLTYTVAYDANGGINPPAPQEKTHDTAIKLQIGQPQRDGYIFIGWSADPKATLSSYSPGGLYDADADITLYAVWQKSSVSIIYGDVDGNGVFNVNDIIYTSLHLKDPQKHPMSYTMSSAADINKDTKVDSMDIELMRIKLAME